jgi:hypothetical protein
MATCERKDLRLRGAHEMGEGRDSQGIEPFDFEAEAKYFTEWTDRPEMTLTFVSHAQHA